MGKVVGKVFGKPGFLFVVFVVICCALPYVFTCEAINERFVFNGENGTGQIGDTIGGIMGPFIAILAAWLTYLVFKSQTDFQKWQDFDSKFYRMLDFHRKNVSEMYLDVTERTTLHEIKGVRCFEEMYKELKLIKALGDYFECNYIDKYPENKNTNFDQNTDDLCYYVFYLGVDRGNDGYVIEHGGVGGNQAKLCFYGWMLAVKKYYLMRDKVRMITEDSLSFFSDYSLFDCIKLDCVKKRVVELYNGMGDDLRLKLDTWCFSNVLDGRVVLIDHYFRNLFNIFDLIEADIPDKNKKSKYYLIIKGQLSAYEIAVLYHHCDSPLGLCWYKNPETRKDSDDNYVKRSNLFEYLLPEIVYKECHENTVCHSRI